jgi:hypothetical protein
MTMELSSFGQGDTGQTKLKVKKLGVELHESGEDRQTGDKGRDRSKERD